MIRTKKVFPVTGIIRASVVMNASRFLVGCTLTLFSTQLIHGETMEKRIHERGFHHVVNKNVRLVELDGKKQFVTNSYVTLAAGMHRMVDGKLEAADPTIELQRGGAIARKTQHKVEFKANINDWKGAIDLETPDGKRFLSRPLGIAYWDGEKSVLIAELQDSTGLLVEPNKIIYPSAFTDFKADLEYNNLLAGLQQNLIFRERPPRPSDYGLDDETAYLELLTEFFEAPEPAKRSRVVNGIEDDRHLDFGSMNIGVGKSFIAGEDGPSCLVEKQWTRIEGRTFLIERVPYRRIVSMLNRLPAVEQAKNGNLKRIHREASKVRQLPERQVAGISREQEIQVADASNQQPGFVIDYTLVTGGLTNFVFEGNKTYLITNRVHLYGTTIFEGGAVIKYKGGLLILEGEIQCQTDAYRPAVFTSWEDDSVGEKIPYSSGYPTISTTCPLILYTGAGTKLKHFRIAYVMQALEISSADATISDCQFLNCTWGVMTLGTDVWMRNNLFYRCDTALGVLEATIHGEHLTINQSSSLAFDEMGLKIRLTNTLLVAVNELGISDINSTNSNFIWLTNDPGVFQSVGAGWHYLAEGSPYRNAGTTNLSEEALKILRGRTTCPPIVLTNNITTNMTLAPVVERETGLPDIGYNYPPIDYVLGQVRINGATLNVTNGAVIGFYAKSNAWSGCTLECGAEFISVGAPDRMNRLIWFNTVQEQSESDWNIVPGWAFPDIFAYDNYSCAGVELKCRFTEFSRLGDAQYHVSGGDVGWDGAIQFRDCVFNNGQLFFYAQGGSYGELEIAITNSLLRRTAMHCLAGDETMQMTAINNLVYGGNISLTAYSVSGTEFANFIFKDNFFFTNDITTNGVMSLEHSYNAYVTNHNRLGAPAAGDVILANVPGFERGALGEFYLPADSPLINAGSQNATNALLYHYTTTTNNVKETNSIVDIGYHYVATDITGVPLDGDEDGLPDYVEDQNGDGIRQSNETDYASVDTDNDDISDYREWLIGGNPLHGGQVFDSQHTNKLQVYTPLK